MYSTSKVYVFNLQENQGLQLGGFYTWIEEEGLVFISNHRCYQGNFN